MTFTLYVREDCHDCKRVASWMEAQGIDHIVDDIDDPQDARVPRLFIAPALCLGGKLCAYGMDIIVYLEAQRSLGQAS